MPNLVIRAMSEGDLEAVLRVIGLNDQTLIPLASQDLHNYFVEPDKLHNHYFVAEITNQVVGIMGFHPDKWGVPDIYWAVWLYVDPLWQRKGVASKLYAAVEKALQNLNCRKAYLDVGNEATHQSAIAFHQLQGFVQEGCLPDYWEDGEDLLIFSKRLKPSK